MKIKILIFACVLAFAGCSDEKKVILKSKDINSTPPSDVPIAKSESNITFDAEYPPVPVSE